MRLFYGVCGAKADFPDAVSEIDHWRPPARPQPRYPRHCLGFLKATPASSQSIPFNLADLARAFPLPWSHYVLLIRRSRSPEAFAFYQAEALRGGWSVRQLQRQIDSQFYERTALSRNKAAMLARGAKPQPGDAVSADEEIRDPLVLEFLGLRDEYSETDLEDALIRHLETFLLELGNDFAFVGRQRRLRIDDEWYRVDLLFFHRRLRCLVIIDLSSAASPMPTPGRCICTSTTPASTGCSPAKTRPSASSCAPAKAKRSCATPPTRLPNKLLVREYLTALPKKSSSPPSWKRRADKSRLGDDGDLTVAIFRQSNEDADHHDVPLARSAHLPPASAGIEPLARPVSGGNSGGNFLPIFSQTSCVYRVFRLVR